MRAESNLIPVASDVQQYIENPKIILDNDLALAFKELRISSLLNSAKIKKRTGHCVNRIVYDLILIPFLMLGSVHLFVRAQYEKTSSDKNRFYRLLEQANYNWRRFILNLSYRIHDRISMPDQEHFLVLDDTTCEVKGKLVEMASYVYDHTKKKSILGFQKLVLGIFDGHHLLPIGERICSGKHTPQATSKATKYRKVPKAKKIDPQSPGAIERKQIKQTKLEKAFSLLKDAQKRGFQASTLLMDSWFCFNSFIVKIVKRLKLQIICQLKHLPRTNNYLFNNKRYTLKALYTLVAKPKLRMVRNYHFKQAAVTVTIPETDVKLKIVFVHNDDNDKWHAFAATNIKLSAKAILEAYSKRWSIEVFFKNSKQHLGYGKEQMSNLDSIIACDALVLMRYAILTYIASKENAKFYTTFDNLREQNSKQCFGIKLLQYFLDQLSFILDKLEEFLQNDFKEQAIELLQALRNLNVQFMPEQTPLK